VEFLIFIAFFIFFWWRSQKKKERKAQLNFTKELKKEQSQYDKHLLSLPSLQGDKTFSQEVVGEQAYAEDLYNFGSWLELNHPGEDVVWVIVENEPENIHDPNAVRVEAGKTTVGYIPRQQAKQFSAELAGLGGKARCAARFYFDKYGDRSSITLDVIRPLVQYPDGEEADY